MVGLGFLGWSLLLFNMGTFSGVDFLGCLVLAADQLHFARAQIFSAQSRQPHS